MIALSLVICASTVFLMRAAAQEQRRAATEAEYEKQYRARAELLLQRYDTLNARDYIVAAVKYSRRTRSVEADTAMRSLLASPRGDMFWMVASMVAYLHGMRSGTIAPDVDAMMRLAWRRYTPYRGDTENHWVMYYSMLFLAAETWPALDGDGWYNGRSSDENRSEAKEFLFSWMKTTTTIGQGEFDSPDYLGVYLHALILLHDFAKDPEVRQLATMMLDLLLADCAADHLNGCYTGGFSRVYEPAVYEPAQAQIAGTAALLFGEGSHSPHFTPYLFALSSYRLPSIIYRMATDRSKAFVNRERKRVRNVIRFGDERNPPVFKYNYVTHDYALGSLQGGILQPIQQHTWGATMRSSKKHPVIFGLHPYWSERELGMFFPEETKTVLADVVASKGTYNNPNKWTGSSPFERTFQDRNTLIVLYDVADGTTTDHIDGFFPKTLDTCIRDPNGWIVARDGDVYVGWFPLQPYNWIEDRVCFRLRSHHPQNGYIVEVRSKGEVGSFARFVSMLRSHVPVASLKPEAVAATYRTIDGRLLSFRFPDERILNGRKIDLGNTPLFDNPFMRAAVGSQRIEMRYGKTMRVYDFSKLTITESPKTR